METLHNIFLSLLILLAASLFSQIVIDPKHMFSKNAFILNAIIVVTLVVYFTNHSKASLYIGLLMLVAVFITLEILHQYGYNLDTYDSKIRNCYTWFNIIQRSKIMGDDLDLTEGKFDCNPFKDYKKAQWDQRDWILKQLDVGEGTRVLEVGSGNCNLLAMAKERGAIVKGITLSVEQARLCRTQRGLDVDVINFWDLDERYFGKYDCVVFNGPVEHFVNQAESMAGKKDAKYRKMFEIVEKLIDKQSKNRKVGITCIHYRNKPDISFYGYFQLYIYERSYGGALPEYPNGLTRNAPQFNVLLKEDHTIDYYITSKLWWDKVDKGNLEPAVLLRCLLYYPLLVFYDQYFVHKILHQIFKSWTWQFEPPSTSGHLWLVMQLRA
jgi:cyclopropane fatty-acyl-phospholipid synthase-like methyltransferase